MRLAAIYLKSHFLFDKPQVINFGGTHYYSIFETNAELIVERAEANSNFINGFWGDQISLVSAIVGENGAGKTSLLRELIDNFDKIRNGTANKNIAFVYETFNDYKVYTNLNYNDKNRIIEHVQEIKSEYYSPVADFDLIDIISGTNFSSKFEGNLEDFYLNSIEKQIIFNYSQLAQNLKNNYEKNFPVVYGVSIKGRLQYKTDFRKVYAISNLQKGMDSALEKLWSKYPFNEETYNQFTHPQNNIIENIEVNILAILTVNNTYSMVQGSGGILYNTDQLLEGEFEEILQKFKQQYIYVVSTDIYEEFLKLKKEKFEKHVIENIKSSSFDNYFAINEVLQLFDAIETFYNFVKILNGKEGFESQENKLMFTNPKQDISITETFTKLIKIYRHLLKALGKTVLPTNTHTLLQFNFYDPHSGHSQKLSTGEKALLNLYSEFYSYTLDSQHNAHKWKYYTLLLDEADLGYHPEWKKRFVTSIVEVLPDILKEIPTFKTLQIIFTTHDPLTLSDIPNSNVIYLKKDNSKKTIILDRNTKPQKSFGANITDLLTDSFFFDDKEKILVGDFAKRKIEDSIRWINDCKKRKAIKAENFSIDNETFQIHKKVIAMIDEPIIRLKLAEMLDELLDKKDLQREVLEREIMILMTKRDNL